MNRGAQSGGRRAILARRLARGLQRRPGKRLEVWLTLKVNFGDAPGDAVTLVDRQHVPLVGSVFENRDRIARGLVRMLIKAASLRPMHLLRRRQGT